MRSMSKYSFLLLVLAPLVVADPASDAVNERIPVSAAEMETHWRVDCEKTWASLGRVAIESGPDGQCLILPTLRRELELCAFIYQPPGGAIRRKCPDFSGALGSLDASDQGDSCDALVNYLRFKGHCPQIGGAR